MELARISMCIMAVAVMAYVADVTDAQTTCAIRLSARDVTVCDDMGALEVNVQGGVYEARGSLNSLQDSQDDTYTILSQQVTHVHGLAAAADADLLDIAGEIRTLKTFLANMAAIQADEAAGPGGVGREKRAASAPSTQQLLNTARAVFQQAIVEIGVKLANLTRDLQDHVTQTGSLHAAIQARLNSNLRDLISTDGQVTTLEQDIQRARASLPTGSGLSLSNASQDVIQLMVESRTSAAITQRELVTMENQVQHLERQEVAVGQGILDIDSITQKQGPVLSNATNGVNVLRSATRIYEDRIGNVITNITRDMAAVQTVLNTGQSLITQLRQGYFNLTLAQSALGADIKSIRPNIDGVQTLVTYNAGISGSQSGDILRLKKSASDDLAVLKYAFGITSTMP